MNNSGDDGKYSVQAADPLNNLYFAARTFPPRCEKTNAKNKNTTTTEEEPCMENDNNLEEDEEKNDDDEQARPLKVILTFLTLFFFSAPKGDHEYHLRVLLIT